MGNIVFYGFQRPGLAAALAARGHAVAIHSAKPFAVPADVIVLGPERAHTGRMIAPKLALLDDRGDAAIVEALDSGADDAVWKGAGDALLAARISALARRPDRATIRVGDLTIDRIERIATRAGRSLDLLPREYALLLCLAQHDGSIVTRQQLRELAFGMAYDPGTNVIEVHISRLRRKLDRGFALRLLRTEKNRGYRLIVPIAVSGSAP